MKIKMFFRIVLGTIILVLITKYYTDYVYNKAIKDYNKKYYNGYSDLNFKNSKDKLKSDPNFKKRLIDSFDEHLYDSIIKTSTYENVLIYSIIISNKWNYSEASFNVFRTLADSDKKNTSTNLPEIDFLDDESKKMALHYLKKAADKENPNAKFILGKYYLEGKYLKKDVELGNFLLQEAKKLSGGILE